MESALARAENRFLKPTLAWLEKTFASKEHDSEGVRKAVVYALMNFAILAVTIISAIAMHTMPFMTHDHDLASSLVMDAAHLTAFAYCIFALVCTRLFGLRSWLKVVLMILWVCWVIVMDVYLDAQPWHFCIVILLDACLILESERDSAVMQGLAMLICLTTVLYLTLRAIDSGGVTLNIHPLKSENCQTDPDPGQILVDLIIRAFPIVTNYGFVRMYFVSAQTEARNVRESVETATLIANKLVNFDLDAAERLLAQADAESPIHVPLSGLLQNLRSYRSFLPYALFANAEEDSIEPPSSTLGEATLGERMSVEHATTAVSRLRDLDYSLGDFHQDCTAAFPELKLYDLQNGSHPCSSGNTGFEEYQRTMGAMYSVYCLARLDIDGKDIFSYGVDENWRPRTVPHGPDAAKKQNFYESVDWKALSQLLVRANILSVKDDGAANSVTKGGTLAGLTKTNSMKRKESGRAEVRLNHDRMLALLVLTAVHDVMKNTELLPIVQEQHAPYKGLKAGTCIMDHDLALAYVMEYFPRLLPSYHALGAGQRAPVLFSQGKMGFNNGWLVQGEAPPGALFSTFKRVIAEGCAGEGDVSFYFAHWITDLAGAVPHGSDPWPGSEKFAAKFPLRVLNAFLESFSFVDKLISKSEVEVMEEYLESRWEALDLVERRIPYGHAPAARRLALMAQGFESHAVDALLALPGNDRETVAMEMARTACRQQFRDAPSELEPGGPALLVYYAPALVQKAGEDQVDMALQLLAAVYRSARFLLRTEVGLGAIDKTVVVRIDSMKVLMPLEILAAAPWHLRRLSDTDMEVVQGQVPFGLGTDFAQIVMPDPEGEHTRPGTPRSSGTLPGATGSITLDMPMPSEGMPNSASPPDSPIVVVAPAASVTS